MGLLLGLDDIYESWHPTHYSQCWVNGRTEHSTISTSIQFIVGTVYCRNSLEEKWGTPAYAHSAALQAYLLMAPSNLWADRCYSKDPIHLAVLPRR